MPAISRGTRSRRQPEEDIEEQEPTQRSRTEDVEEAVEEQGRRSSRRSSTRGVTVDSKTAVKREKVAKATRKRASNTTAEGLAQEVEEGNGAVEDTGPTIDVENFHDQPLADRDVGKIRGFRLEWAELLKSFADTAVVMGIDVAEAMAEVGMGRDGEAALAELETVDVMMRELIDTQAEMKAHVDVLEDIASSIEAGEDVDNVLSRYEHGVGDMKEGWESKTSRQRYGDDKAYKEFKQKIFEIQNGPEEAMPPMTEFIPKEDGDESDEDEIVVGGVSQVYTCPLSLTPLVEPMTSQICNHTFSKTSIHDYFNNNRSIRKTCPATGCNQQFTLMDLKANKNIEKAVKAHLRRQRQREAEADSDNDDAEVIE